MGIRSTWTLNGALLNKWLWRFGVEQDSLWQKMIVAKYREELNDWVSCRPTRAHGSGVWPGIFKGMNSFARYTWFKVNNGEIISILDRSIVF